MQGLYPALKKGVPLSPALADEAARLENHPAVKLCGIEKILDRGLKYMSTGEIRRTLLARALVSGKKFLILSDPFAGLDIQSRTILLDFFNNIVAKHSPAVILGMERWHEIPDAITHVLEFRDKAISFCGSRADYEKLREERAAGQGKPGFEAGLDKESLTEDFKNTLRETAVLVETEAKTATQTQTQTQTKAAKSEVLVEMKDVHVGWDGKYVLDGLNWTLRAGEHWLVRGPNGSGKTTFLELITGDNMQVFSNDIKIFGNRRGSGESIWDIKKKLGIVSYRMHVEYRMLGGTCLL